MLLSLFLLACDTTADSDALAAAVEVTTYPGGEVIRAQVGDWWTATLCTTRARGVECYSLTEDLVSVGGVLCYPADADACELDWSDGGDHWLTVATVR